MLRAPGTGRRPPASTDPTSCPSSTRIATGHPSCHVLPRQSEVVGAWNGAQVACGTGDNMAAALGLGLEPGVAVLSLGTSGTAYAVSDHPTADASGAVAGFADASGRYLPLACTLNATKVTDAIARLLGVDHAEFDRLALAAPAGRRRADDAAVLRRRANTQPAEGDRVACRTTQRCVTRADSLVPRSKVWCVDCSMHSMRLVAQTPTQRRAPRRRRRTQCRVSARGGRVVRSTGVDRATPTKRSQRARACRRPLSLSVCCMRRSPSVGGSAAAHAVGTVGGDPAGVRARYAELRSATHPSTA